MSADRSTATWVGKMMVTHGDLDPDHYLQCVEEGVIAWDIETSGLDWSTDRIGTCQVATKDTISVVLIDDTEAPKQLSELLADANVRKVFHHAPFDLRFMMRHWEVEAASVTCTKIASKIAFPELSGSEHSLKPVLERLLGVSISKQQQVSDWLTADLTEAQLEYAATDVAYLVQLCDLLTQRCQELGAGPLLEASWEYLPTRAALDLLGPGDVFSY